MTREEKLENKIQECKEDMEIAFHRFRDGEISSNEMNIAREYLTGKRIVLEGALEMCKECK